MYYDVVSERNVPVIQVIYTKGIIHQKNHNISRKINYYKSLLFDYLHPPKKICSYN